MEDRNISVGAWGETRERLRRFLALVALMALPIVAASNIASAQQATEEEEEQHSTWAGWGIDEFDPLPAEGIPGQPSSEDGFGKVEDIDRPGTAHPIPQYEDYRQERFVATEETRQEDRAPAAEKKKRPVTAINLDEYSYVEKERFEYAMNNRLKRLEDKVDRLEDRAERDGLTSQQRKLINDFERKHDAVEDDLERIVDVSEAQWDDYKISLRDQIAEIEQSYEQLQTAMQ